VVARKSFFIMDPLVRSCINFHEPLHQCFPRQQLEYRTLALGLTPRP